MEDKPNLTGIPPLPGCYLMKSAEGTILYVGKAVHLRNRVRSYFRASANHSPRIALMVSLVDRVDFITTKNEVEALILENILIKKELPRFNVMLKDDKTYPYLKLTVKEKFPRLFIVRKVLNDGSQYFGPYISAGAVRAVKQVLNRIFPIRQSKDNLDDAPLRRPCLNYQMKRCLAPCAGKISEEEYRTMLDSVVKFIKGRDNEVTKELKAMMEREAEKHEFEKAAIIRDQIFAIEKIHQDQKIDAASGDIDEDYIAAATEAGVGVVRLMMVRRGKLVGDQNFTFKKVDDEAELVEAFIGQFYQSPFSIPSEVIVSHLPNELETVEKWLTKERGTKVEIKKPERGRKKQILSMVMDNAKLKLLNFASSTESIKEALREVKETIDMEEWPAVIECVDLSNIQGVSAVGSLVSFHNGEADKKNYKRYRIKGDVAGDTAMMMEVVYRRFSRIQEEGGRFPDLLLVDGGLGQVHAAMEAVASIHPSQVIVGIAKGKDRENSSTDIFIKGGVKEPLPFPPASPGRFLLQRVRDEAHRFAINYHREARSKEAFKSSVDEVRGMGPKRKKKLLSEFGSLKAAKEAGVADIAKALSVNEKLAAAILEKL